MLCLLVSHHLADFLAKHPLDFILHGFSAGFAEMRPHKMMVLDLRGGKAVPQWQMLTREEFAQGDQKGHRSLREEYGGGDGSKK